MTKKITGTVDEAAEVLDVARNTAYQAVRNGEIPSEGDQVDVFAADALEGLGAAARLENPVVRGQDHPQGLPRSALVVHDQDGFQCSVVGHWDLRCRLAHTRIANDVPDSARCASNSLTN